jgi:glycosyltransferase involved in cell wall biosynthesis
MNNPLVSIIIPISNVEQYLNRTLESALSQSYQNIEVICVLDSPTDSSGSIAKKYQQQDQRMEVIEQDYLGVSATRNNGIKHAKGEYIFFLDSDDWLAPNAIELLVASALETGAKVTCGGIVNVDTSTLEESIYNSKRKTGTVDLHGKRFFDLEIMIWNKLYHKGVHSDLYFTPNLIHEDEEFYWNFFAKHRHAYCIEDNIIFYNRRNNSITTTSRHDEAYQMNYVKVIDSAYKVVQSNPDLMYHFRKRAIKYLRKIKTKNAPYSIYQEHIAKKYGLRDDFFTKLKTDLIKLTC